MIDPDAFHPDDILCVIDVHAGGHSWNSPMADWQKRHDAYKEKKVKNLFGRFARAPKPPKDGREDYPDENWFDTFVLDDATIPAILAKVAEFEKEARALVTPPPGWQATSEVQTIVYIGRPDQFCIAMPPRQLLPQAGKPWPETLVDTAVTATAIGSAMDRCSSPTRKKRLEKTPQQREAELNAVAQAATVAKSRITVMAPISLKR